MQKGGGFSERRDPMVGQFGGQKYTEIFGKKQKVFA